MQAVKIALPRFIQLNFQVKTIQIKPLENNGATQLERKRINNRKLNFSPFQCGDKLSRLLIVKFQIA